jgi:hypothetical protein
MLALAVMRVWDGMFRIWQAFGALLPRRNDESCAKGFVCMHMEMFDCGEKRDNKQSIRKKQNVKFPDPSGGWHFAQQALHRFCLKTVNSWSLKNVTITSVRKCVEEDKLLKYQRRVLSYPLISS